MNIFIFQGRVYSYKPAKSASGSVMVHLAIGPNQHVADEAQALTDRVVIRIPARSQACERAICIGDFLEVFGNFDSLEIARVGAEAVDHVDQLVAASYNFAVPIGGSVADGSQTSLGCAPVGSAGVPIRAASCRC